MFTRRAYTTLVSLLFCSGMAACAGSPRLDSLPMNTSQESISRTYQIAGAEGVNASLVMRSSTPLKVAFHEPRQSQSVRTRAAISLCGSIPPIEIDNPTPLKFTVTLFSFTVRLRCVPNQTLFGASFFQISPLPPVVSPNKLGNASIVGSTLTFTPAETTLTLLPHTTSEIVVLPEKLPDEVALPIDPFSTTNLTENNQSLASTLAFTYQTAAGGGTIYTVACFNAFTNGMLAHDLLNVPLVGTPSLFCHIFPADSPSITFGNTVQFDIAANPDRPIFEPDGTPQGFSCTLAGQCNLPSFTVPTTYETFIAGNALDPSICVPATANVDCNGVSGDPQGAKRTTVSSTREFQVLVADDPTYKPGVPNAPWDGLFRMHFAGPCKLSSSADAGNGDMPPKYSDNGQIGTGPNAEFDVVPTGKGPCVITASEDTRYLLDYSDPLHPKARTAAVSLTLQ